MNFVNGKVGFFILYLLLMFPTYVLPWLGSTSSVLNAAGVASGVGMNPLWFVHLFSLLCLVGLGWLRGIAASKAWLVVFPTLALVFDLFPFLNWIPFVPTVMHILALVFGVIETNSSGAPTTAQS